MSTILKSFPRRPPRKTWCSDSGSVVVDVAFVWPELRVTVECALLWEPTLEFPDVAFPGPAEVVVGTGALVCFAVAEWDVVPGLAVLTQGGLGLKSSSNGLALECGRSACLLSPQGYAEIQ